MFEKELEEATGHYDKVIKKFCKKLHQEISRLIDLEDLSSAEQKSILFDTLFTLMMNYAHIAHMPEDRFHETVTWFYQQYKAKQQRMN